VKVILERVDANERKLQFSLVEEERSKPRAKRTDAGSRRKAARRR
jgi:hypothetical protein